MTRQGSLDDEQRFLRDAVRTLARDVGVRADVAPESLDAAAAWTAIVDAGFAAVAMPDGGTEPRLLDVVLVAEAFGRHVCPAPFLGTAALGVPLARAAAAEDLATELAAGRPAAVALGDGLRRLGRVGAEDDLVAWDAPASGVTGGVVLALDAAGTALVARDLGPGDEPIEGFDVVRGMRRCTGDGWRRVGTIEPAALARWEAHALVTVSAELLGVMDGALEMAVAHAQERRQFDRPIGSFQAIQHLCADAYVAVESTRSAVYGAADLAADGDDATTWRAARRAKLHASARVREVVEAALQVHGGIGMTWELPGHLYLRRAVTDRAVLGDDQHHLRSVAAELLATPS